MAKKSLIVKENKRISLAKLYYEKRAELRISAKNPMLTEDERQAAQFSLQKLPRDSSSIRIRNRCSITGRPHGYYRKFGLSRNKLREAVMRGDVPGVKKASW